MSDRRFLVVPGTWGHGKLRALLWRWIPEERRPKETAWDDPEHYLARAWGKLRTALATQGSVECFIWSGKNSHKARIAAGENLARRVEKLLGENPGEQLYIVTHSHGGNVVLYALHALSDELRKRVGGLVCMATPFLHFRPQQLDTSVFRALPLILGFILFGAVFIAWMFAWVQFDPDGQLPSLVVVLPGLALSLLVVALVERLTPGKRALAELPGKILAYCKSAQPPPPEGTRVVLTRKAGDEAAAALVGGRLLELILSGLWRASGAIVKELPDSILARLASLKMTGRIVVSSVVIAVGVVGYRLLVGMSDVEDPPIMGYALMAVVGLILVIALVQTVLGLLIPW